MLCLLAFVSNNNPSAQAAASQPALVVMAPDPTHMPDVRLVYALLQRHRYPELHGAALHAMSKPQTAARRAILKYSLLPSAKQPLGVSGLVSTKTVASLIPSA